MSIKPFAALILAAAASLAAAQPVSYARISREIKAGTLLVTGQTVSGRLYDPAPHVWYAMDQEQGIKPASWTFVNPLGQTTLTASMMARWALGSPYATGQILSKRDASYWEVDLANTGDSSLSQFDVLLLPVRQGVTLTAIEREKLRRFVDQGGILWIDFFSGSAMDLTNGLPVPLQVVTGTTDLSANTSHPLLNTPNAVSLDDLINMRRGNYTVTKPFDSTGGPASLLATIPSDSYRWEGVSGNTSGFALSTCQLGDGFLISTGFNLSSLISRGVSGTGITTNEGFRSLPIFFDGLYIAGAKLVANITAAGSSRLMPGGGSRKDNAIKGDVPAPLLQRFRVTNGSFGRTSEAAHANGYIVVAEGNTLNCFDADPSRDIDGDGNPDDGIANPAGSDFDIVWSVTLDGTVSSPVVAEVANTTLGGSAQVPQQVWTVTSRGTVYVHALQTGSELAKVASPNNVDPSVGPFSPTIHEGVVAITEGVTTGFGRVRLIDLASATPIASGSNQFSLQGTSRLEVPTASVSMGYIPILDNSGGLDRVIYEAGKASGGGASLTSLWLGAKGESPTRIQRSGNSVVLSTRASLQGLPVFAPSSVPSPYGIRITLLEPGTGRPLTAAEMNGQLTNSVSVSATAGDINLTLTAGHRTDWDWDGQSTPNDASDDVGWRVDYTIDWSRAASNNPTSDSYVRGNLVLPDNSSNLRTIIGSPAMTSRGNVIVVQSNPATRTGPNINEGGTTIYNFREEGRGDFSLVNRFDMFDTVQITYNQTTKAEYRETIIDQDALLDQLPNFLKQPITDVRATGGPTVIGDTVYVMGCGYKDIGFGQVPTGVLVALNANPDPVQFYARNVSEDTNSTYSIVQADPVRSSAANRTSPEQVSSLARSLFTIEETNEAGLYKVTLNSLMGVRRGQIRDAVSTSLPLILRRSNNGTDMLIEPEATASGTVFQAGSAGNKFSPMRWYYVANGYNPFTAPIAAGRTLYIGGSSVLPSILVSGISGLQERGLLYGLDAEISANDSFLVANTIKPWFSQLSTILPNSATPWDVKAADVIRWPQPQGIKSFDDFRVRVLQNTLPEQRVLSLSAGDGTLAAFSQGASGDALTVYSQADFSVADSQRVARFDSAGNPLWVLQTTGQLGAETTSGAASKAAPLVEPTRIYPDGQDYTWIVDAGSSRILLVDRAGREQRTITKVRLHPSRNIAEFSAGESLDLSSPRDISVYSRTYTAAQVASFFPGEVLESAAGPELWRHILIADTGNHRAVEVVDRYRLDSQGRIIGVVRYQSATGELQPAYAVALWHSPQELSGGSYGYNSIARLTDPANPSNRITAIGFSSAQPGRATVGLDTPQAEPGGATGFGGVVLYDESRGDTLLLTDFTVPALTSGAFLGAPSGGRYYFNSTARASETHRISGLTSVTLSRRIIGGQLRLAVMISEASGVYELIQTNPGATDAADRSVWQVQWMMPKEAYLAMRRTTTVDPASGYAPGDLSSNAAGFRPMHARRLDSGEVLIVNGYTGTTFGPSPSAFNGEVILVEGRDGSSEIPGYSLSSANLGFNSLSVRYELPPVAGIRDLIRPVFAERR